MITRTADPGQPTKIRAWFAIRLYLVPIILMVIASIHAFRVFRWNQSSWGAGCGFGMFATVDYHGSRWVRAYLVTPHGEFPASPESKSDELDLLCRVQPTEDNLSELAEYYRTQAWILDEYSERDLLPGSEHKPLANLQTTRPETRQQPLAFRLGDRLAPQVSAIRVELWGLGFDQHQKRLTQHLINKITISGDDQTDEPR